MSTQSQQPAISPLAPKTRPQMRRIDGLTMAAAQAGVRYRGRFDVMLAKLEPGSAIAGVFTRSATRSAPVLWCEQALAAQSAASRCERPIGILVNSGNSNAFTGAAGEASTNAVAHKTAAALGCEAESDLFLASTGVIGERLPHERIEAVIDDLATSLSADAWDDAAAAILTTDTFPKYASASAEIDGVEVAISGFAKGSGMIAPDMATMLGFVFTDAAITQQALQTLLTRANQTSFNAVTVDGDTSTSDTVLLGATCKAGNALIDDADDPQMDAFQAALQDVLGSLAQQLARDGEGASKFITVEVSGAASDASAHRVGLSIANSPLVKTAFAGEDPNWGRIVMAVGKAGEPADRDLLTIQFGEIVVAEKGWVAASYREEDGAAYMKGDELTVRVDLGIGQGRARIWTCDLTHGYISINADYRS